MPEVSGDDYKHSDSDWHRDWYRDWHLDWNSGWYHNWYYSCIRGWRCYTGIVCNITD